MKTLKLTDEQFEKVKEILAESVEKPKKKTKTIIYRNDGSILYESDKETIKEAVEKAIGKGTELWGTELWGISLSEADLSEADLSEADFSGAKFYGKGGASKLKKDQVEDFLLALGFIVKD